MFTVRCHVNHFCDVRLLHYMSHAELRRRVHVHVCSLGRRCVTCASCSRTAFVRAVHVRATYSYDVHVVGALMTLTVFRDGVVKAVDGRPAEYLATADVHRFAVVQHRHCDSVV